MGGSKLRTIHVMIIGTIACLIVLLGSFFTVIKSRYEAINGLKASLATETAKYNEKASWEVRLADAKAENRRVSAQYEKYLRTKMPAISFENRTQGMIALWREQGQVLGPLLQSWPSKTGVTYMGGLQLPAPPVDPNSIDTTLIKIPVGTFQVRGDFRSILAHIRKWRDFHRLVQIDPVSLSGPSPGMTAQYTVTVYIFPRGEAGPTISMAGGGGQGAAGGFAGAPAMGGFAPPPGAPPGGLGPADLPAGTPPGGLGPADAPAPM